MSEVVDVEVDSLNVNGDGVVRDGRTRLTIPFTLPGERVRIRLDRGTTGSLVEVLRPSPHRVQPGCRHFGVQAEGGRTCGGCSWQHIAYGEQLRLKSALVTRLVREQVPSALGSRSVAAMDSFDAAVLDPPREGCDTVVLDRVFGRNGPAVAVYVSCDPQSLARDLARITSGGYTIESMQPVDMFPHTPHVETVVVLRRSRERPTSNFQPPTHLTPNWELL